MAQPPDDWAPLLGRKVSIRYRLHHDPEHPFSEAIGVVGSVSSESVTIHKRDGSSISVAPRDVLAAKVFPVSG